MSEEHEIETTEDGFVVDENGEILADPADLPSQAPEEAAESPDEEEVDEATARMIAGPDGGVLDFLLTAPEAATLLSDLFREKVTATAFRQLVMDGEAPMPEEQEVKEGKKPGPSKWSMLGLRQWAKKEIAERAAAEPQDVQEDEPQTDFLLAARDAAGLISDQLGRRIHTAAFRQLVLEGQAPAPTETTDGTAKWSQRALHAWTDEIREAEEARAAEIDPLDVALEESSAFVLWVQDRISRFESFEYERLSTAWCPQWWDHPEAVDRLHALWSAYLAAEAEGEVSGWWVNHWDRHFPFLFGRDGVFAQCDQKEHVPGTDRRWLEQKKAPTGWLPYPERIPEPGHEAPADQYEEPPTDQEQ